LHRSSTPVVGSLLPANSSHFTLPQKVTAELVSKSPWPEKVSPSVLFHQIERCASEGKVAEAVQLVDDVVAKAPDNLLLLMRKVELLLEDGRDEEALVLNQRLLDRTDLISETRTFLFCNRVLSLAKRGQNQPVHDEVEAFLHSSVSGAEKLLLLDRLACLPIMEGAKAYLGEAEHWVKQALEIQPANLTLK